MNILRIVTLVIMTAISLPAIAAPGFSRQETIRVAILKGVDTVKLDGSGVLTLVDDGEPIRSPLPLILKRSGSSISVGGRTISKLVASGPAFVIANGKSYRGLIEVIPFEKGLLVVNELPLEDYLIGLINCEISSQWPMEAVKAQAVIARSYAVYQKEARKGAPYHLESTVMDQVYDGCEIEDSRAVRGVHETEGEVLTYNGSVIQAFYHSSCGGHTESAENVWGYRLPYVTGVDCKYCVLAPSVRWEQTLSLKKIETLLKNAGIAVSGVKGIKAGKRNASGRLNDVQIITARGSQSVPAVKFRQAIGYGVIKSTDFTVKENGDDVFFMGMGYGHGVGLCQWGAKIRASDGFDYREILLYYYPGTLLEKRNTY